MDERSDEIKTNLGLLLSVLNENKVSKKLADYEFKIFSQWGEDGIIQFLTKALEIRNRTFIEFGVEDFQEANCRFLLIKDNWKGFVIDGSKSNIQRLRTSYSYWRYHIDSIVAFITKENINELLGRSGFSEDLGILSIDLDGNDYFICSAITNFKPRILICEYNAVFGPVRKISVPYNQSFDRTTAHHSNLYWGASLAAMTHIANKKGYALVGTNSAGNNAFFVRRDVLNNRVVELSPEAAYSCSNFRESRDSSGNLTFAAGECRIEIIRGLPILNVDTGEFEKL